MFNFKLGSRLSADILTRELYLLPTKRQDTSLILVSLGRLTSAIITHVVYVMAAEIGRSRMEFGANHDSCKQDRAVS